MRRMREKTAVLLRAFEWYDAVENSECKVVWVSLVEFGKVGVIR